jgi:glycosyltransferase involved in cell wall biosynthesis
MFLERTLRSIAEQRIFRESALVEVVISDNGSSDSTRDVALVFQKRFPEKTRYMHNEETTHSSLNFARALRCGGGTLLKLHNDTLPIQDGFLEEAVALAQCHAEQKPVVFFLNRNTRARERETRCGSLDSFVRHVSFYSTWIGGFAVWADEVERCAALFEESRNHFAQVEWLFTNLAEGREAVVYNPFFCGVLLPLSGRNADFLFHVFVREYTEILDVFRASGCLAETVYRRELKNFFARYIVTHFYALRTTATTDFLDYMRPVRAYADAWYVYFYPLIQLARIMRRKCIVLIRNNRLPGTGK